jgi:tetratricopeptide (TPR) repeat protein
MAEQEPKNRADESHLREILSRQPHNTNTWLKLAQLFEAQRRWNGAIEAYRALLQLQPTNQQALSHLGYCLRHHGQLAEAEKILRQAIALSPSDAEALHDLGAVLLAMERAPEAVAALQAATAARPDYVDAWCTLAAASCAAGQVEQARTAAERALSMRPSSADAWCNLALAQVEAGKLDEAVDAYRQALAHTPGFMPGVWGLVWTLLAQGHYRQAWPIFETRRRLGADFYHHRIDKPLWEGEPLAGRCILLHPEKGNGFGEVIQMARFVPPVAARGGKVILECQPPLLKLFQTLAGVEQIVALGQPLPEHQLHCPLMSLPSRFDITLENIPAAPYLTADPVKVEQWKKSLIDDHQSLKVGLVWAGRSQPPHRSIDPRLLAPCGSVEGVKFFSLQRTDEAHPYARLRPEFPFTDCAPQLHDFSDTAALLMNLDLLISIDTAAVHLAGALGRPAWLLARFAADWRWLGQGSVSSWYPTIRIFRQDRPGDWTRPIEQIVAELASAMTS